MKKYLYPIVITILLLIAGGSLFAFTKTNSELKETRTLHALLMKDYDVLKAKDDKKKDELDKLKKDFDKTNKELDKSKKEIKKLTDNNQVTNNDQQSNVQVESSEMTNEMPITEYKVPNEDDLKEMAEQHAKEQEAKVNEPQYATAIAEQFSVLRFSMDNGITTDLFYELNPGVDKIQEGSSYRIK